MWGQEERQHDVDWNNTEAFDLEMYTHGYWWFWAPLAKRGLVSCLPSSQRVLSILWLEPSLSLWEETITGVWKLEGIALWGLSEPLLASRDAVLLVTGWCQIATFFAFQVSNLFQRLRDLRRVCVHSFTSSWFASLSGLLAYLGSTGQVVLWAKDSKTILIISKGNSSCFSEPDL